MPTETFLSPPTDLPTFPSCFHCPTAFQRPQIARLILPEESRARLRSCHGQFLHMQILASLSFARFTCCILGDEPRMRQLARQQVAGTVGKTLREIALEEALGVVRGRVVRGSSDGSSDSLRRRVRVEMKDLRRVFGVGRRVEQLRQDLRETGGPGLVRQPPGGPGGGKATDARKTAGGRSDRSCEG